MLTAISNQIRDCGAECSKITFSSGIKVAIWAALFFVVMLSVQSSSSSLQGIVALSYISVTMIIALLNRLCAKKEEKNQIVEETPQPLPETPIHSTVRPEHVPTVFVERGRRHSLTPPPQAFNPVLHELGVLREDLVRARRQMIHALGFRTEHDLRRIPTFGLGHSEIHSFQNSWPKLARGIYSHPDLEHIPLEVFIVRYSARWGGSHHTMLFYQRDLSIPGNRNPEWWCLGDTSLGTGRLPNPFTAPYYPQETSHFNCLKTLITGRDPFFVLA